MIALYSEASMYVVPLKDMRLWAAMLRGRMWSPMRWLNENENRQHHSGNFASQLPVPYYQQERERERERL